MMTKRVLSMVLCLCMVLSCLPAMGLVAFAEETTPVTVRIEAENAVWNRYTKVSDAAFSGGGKLGSANGTYFAWDEISGGHFNKNNWVYVAYYVDAPEAGTYQVSVAANMQMTADCTPYAAILVNPLSDAETISYKIPYAPIVANTTTYLESQKVDVQLLKGRNVIYMTPFTGDQAKNWADTDYIEITGAQAVTHVASQHVKLDANVGYYYKASNVSATALAGGVHDPINNEGIHAENITRDFLKNITHTSITVEAPADGYYDLSYTIAGASSNGSGNFALALFVDDATTAEPKPYIWNNELVDVSTYLTKGIHTLTITTSMPKNQAAADAADVAWTDLKGLTLSGGLKLAKYQDSPMHAGNVLEAERDGYAWRYPDISTDSNSPAVGGSQPGATRQTYADLAGGAKLNKNQPMVTYYIDVETTGTYTMNASFQGYTGDNYYMIVSVDDQTYYKAGINGADPTRNNRMLATANLELTAGRHFVRLITLANDNGANWINVDYAEFAGPGNVKAMKDQLHLSATEAHYMQGFDSTGVDHSGNGAQWANAIGYYKGNSWAAAAGVTTENFTLANLPNLGWFSYTVSVPADGYYDLQTYMRPNTSKFGTGKILLVIDQEYRWVDVTLDKDASKWWIADLTSYLTKGDHVILVSGLMDYKDAEGNPNETDWCDMGALTVSGGITKSANPINPLHQGECVLEAESDGIVWRYLTTDQGQVGGSQPADDSYNQSYEDLIAEGAVFEKRHQPSVSFVVDVETAGTYDLIASYKGYNDESYYMVIAIDDETFVKTAYAGVDDTDSAFLLTKASVELTAGRHVIRLLPMTKGTGASWINVNYLKIEGVADVENVTEWTHLYAYDAPYILNFVKKENPDNFSEWGDAQWAKALGGYQGNSCMENAGVTSDNFTLQDLGHMGWFSYTLNVPADGYYDLQTCLRPNNSTSGTGKILVIVDQQIEWVDADYNIYPFRWNTVDLSRYLTAGDHTILISGLVDYTGGSRDWCDMGALSVSGGITVSENQIDPKSWLTPAVEEYNVFLADNIGMKFKLDGYAVGDDVSFYIGETKIDRINLTGGVFAVELAAAQMTDEITLKVNGDTIGYYSVREYAETIMNDDKYNDVTKALVTEMLHYGAAAQKHFQYKADDLADNNRPEKGDTSLTLEATEIEVADSINGLGYYGASLLFRNKITVRFYFTGSVEGCTFTVENNAYEPVLKDGRYYVDVQVESPDKLGDPITLVVTDANEATITVTYGPMDYISRVYNKETTSASLKTLLENLYDYYDAAYAYVKSIAAV